MPNWCQNIVSIQGDYHALEKMVELEEGLFDYIFPMPDHICADDDSWYDWCCNNWGTKWDIDEWTDDLTSSQYSWEIEVPAYRASMHAILRGLTLGPIKYLPDDTLSECLSYVDPPERVGWLTMTFETAWGPPQGIYEKLEEQGYEVTAYYYEPGQGFCGKYEEGRDYWIGDIRGCLSYGDLGLFPHNQTPLYDGNTPIREIDDMFDGLISDEVLHLTINEHEYIRDGRDYLIGLNNDFQDLDLSEELTSLFTPSQP